MARSPVLGVTPPNAARKCSLNRGLGVVDNTDAGIVRQQERSVTLGGASLDDTVVPWYLLVVSQPEHVVPADERAGEVQEGFVHRDEALVPDGQTPVARQPRERALHDPAVSLEPVLGLDALPRDAGLDGALTGASRRALVPQRAHDGPSRCSPAPRSTGRTARCSSSTSPACRSFQTAATPLDRCNDSFGTGLQSPHPLSRNLALGPN